MRNLQSSPPNKKNYGDESNNYSVGILLTHGSQKFIFTGDAEEEAESDITKNKIDISANVLQVGHHGSKTASTTAFLKAVSPEYAVISCGENNEYGHPHASTLNSLRGMGVKVFRTDEQGSLVATSDGKKITWNAAPSETWKSGEPTKSAGKKTEKVDSAAPAPVQELGNTTVQTDSAPAAVVEAPQPPQDTQGISYVLNSKTKKFHKTSCGSLPTSNRVDSNASRDEIISQGYVPCKKCNP